MTDVNTSPQELAGRLLSILTLDREERLKKIDRYLHGDQDDPYMPDDADDEYRLLAARSITNIMPTVVKTPNQALYLDGFRRSTDDDPLPDNAPEWKHFERSHGRSRQKAIHAGAITYGHSFTLTEKNKQGKVRTTGLSAMDTAALFEDPANDITPYASLHIDKRYRDSKGDLHQEGRLWIGNKKHLVHFRKGKASVGAGVTLPTHPITRFAVEVDLEGRTTGLVWPMIALQDRLNQTVFDLLVAQTYTSFEVRTATGMVPPLKREIKNKAEIDAALAAGQEPPEAEWGPKIDPNTGAPEVDRVKLSGRQNFLFAEDPEAKFGTLKGTPLDGFISSVEMNLRMLSATGQIPPHYLLGQIANLSAEAIDAAETSLARLVQSIQASFSESWEQVFRIAALLEGIEEAMEDYEGEVIWRDMESRSMSKTADALGKLRENVEAPVEGLWRRIPGMTTKELSQWKSLREREDPARELADAARRATTPPLPLDDEDAA